jgi:enolase
MLSSNEEVFDIIQQAAAELKYVNTKDFNFAIDAASTEFYKDGAYVLKKTNQTLTGKDLINYYITLQKKYSILSYEDPFAEDDWDHFAQFTPISKEYIVVGDDLFVTNPKRIKKGIENKSANAVLIKLNQIGSVYETMEAIKMTRNAGWKVIISHRSGETEDAFIADVAYGVGADFIKTGSMSRSERLAKYNRLIEIENKL